MSCTWILTEPKPGVVGLEITTGAGNVIYCALTEKEADALHNDLGIELYDRDVRKGKMPDVDDAEALNEFVTREERQAEWDAMMDDPERRAAHQAEHGPVGLG